MNVVFLGETRLGLMWTCMTLYNRPQVCFTPELQPEWLLALICIFVGCICITTAIILLASSNWDRDVIPYARWVGFTASKLIPIFFILFCNLCVSEVHFWTREQNVCPFFYGFPSSKLIHLNGSSFISVVLFCLAAVIFPLGFHIDEIGGQPYQLPNSHQVGFSYIMFVLALWITVISELFAGKVCLPHF